MIPYISMPKLKKEFDVTINIKCYQEVYGVRDLENLLQVFRDINGEQ